MHICADRKRDAGDSFWLRALPWFLVRTECCNSRKWPLTIGSNLEETHSSSASPSPKVDPSNQALRSQCEICTRKQFCISRYFYSESSYLSKHLMGLMSLKFMFWTLKTFQNPYAPETERWDKRIQNFSSWRRLSWMGGRKSRIKHPQKPGHTGTTEMK